MSKSQTPPKTPERGRSDQVAELRALFLAGQQLRHAIAESYRLSWSEMVVLVHLADAGGSLGPGELAERMLVGSGTLTAVVGRLERGGYAGRRPHSADRRRVVVSLTPPGREVIRRIERHLRRALDRAVEEAGQPQLTPLVMSLEAEAEKVRRGPVRRADRSKVVL